MNNRRKIIIIISLVVLVVILSIIFIALKTSHKSTPPQTGNSSYVDPASGTTVSSPNGKTPEPLSGYNGVVYLGFSSLIDDGLSNDQFNNVKLHLAAYYENSSVGSEKITQVSLQTSSITQNNNPDSGIIILKANLIINKTITQHMILHYNVLGHLVMDLTDTNNTLIYSSVDSD